MIIIDKTMKCQLLLFSYLFEVELLQGCRDGCFDSFRTDRSHLCAHSFACTCTKSSWHVPIAFKKLSTFGGVMWQLYTFWYSVQSYAHTGKGSTCCLQYGRAERTWYI